MDQSDNEGVEHRFLINIQNIKQAVQAANVLSGQLTVIAVKELLPKIVDGNGDVEVQADEAIQGLQAAVVSLEQLASELQGIRQNLIRWRDAR